MFLGEYEHTLDAKGRMAVPARYRAQMDAGAVISKGMGPCLAVYTMNRWEEKSAELVAGKSNDELRDFERRIYPSASEIDLDGQGRMMIPARLNKGEDGDSIGHGEGERWHAHNTNRSVP